MQKKNKNTDPNNTNRKDITKMKKVELINRINELETELEEQVRSHNTTRNERDTLLATITNLRDTNTALDTKYKSLYEHAAKQHTQLQANNSTPTEKPCILIVNGKYLYEFPTSQAMSSWTMSKLESYTFVKKVELSTAILITFNNVKSKKTK